MKQTLTDHIRENEDLRKVLLAQGGGITKYLAEHLDANGNAELFHAYQDHCVDIFFEKNKWDLRVVWEGENMRRAALGETEHLWKELRYQRILNDQLAVIPAEITERIDDFNEQYLTWAYKQDRQRRYPKGMTPIDFYREIIVSYNSSGLAYKCMKIVLREHHANGKLEKSESDLFTEFIIRQFIDNLTTGDFALLRQAVAEMLNGKDPDQCRQMAIDTMERVRGFSQMIYTGSMVQALREINFNIEADQRERDGEWLRDVAQRAVLEEFSDHVKTHSMGYYFALFVNLLIDLGRIWAAQLLVHGIDMKELEKGVDCIMNPTNTPRYYVDKYYSDDLPHEYCVSNDRRAEELLKKMGREFSQKCYLKLPDDVTDEKEFLAKLCKAYNVLTKEGFIDARKTKMETFTNVMMNNQDAKIYWQNDPRRKFLKEFILVILGISLTYDYSPLLTPSDRGKQWSFVKQHFVDEKGDDIKIKSNSTKLGKRDIEQFERILKAIHVYVKYRKSPK